MLWAVVMAVAVCLWEGSPAPHDHSVALGAGACIALGVLLGWTRRTASAFWMPLVSWLFGWFPLWITAIVRHGFIRGLFVGLFLVTIGWAFLGAVEVFVIGFTASIVRMIRGPSREADIEIIGPQR